jgi:hypothetical protein
VPVLAFERSVQEASPAGSGGYASTTAKHGTAVFTAIRDALAGNPLDAAHPGQRLNDARNLSRMVTQELQNTLPDVNVCAAMSD